MDRTVMGLFDEHDAEAMVIALRSSGIPLSRISVIDEEENEGAPKRTVGTGERLKEELVEKSTELWDRVKAFFKKSDYPEHHADYFAEGIRRGCTMVAVDVPDMQADRVRDLMEQH